MKHIYRKYLKRIVLFYLAIPLLIAGILYPLLPNILNYPPNSINNQFQITYDGLTYTQQYFLLIGLILFSSLIFLFIRIYQINKCFSKLENNVATLSNKDKITLLTKVRTFCLNTPYLLYFLEIIIPLVLLPLTFLLIKAYYLTIIKICLVYILFFTLGSVISFVFSKNEFRNILLLLHDTYPALMSSIEDSLETSKKNNIKSLPIKLMLQLFPLVLLSLVFTSLVCYVQAAKKTGDIYYSSYKALLSPVLDETFKDKNDLYSKLSSINLINESHNFFIIDADGNYITSDNSELQPFFIRYAIELSSFEKGHSYDYFCLDTEGITESFTTLDGNTYYAGFSYDTSQYNLLKFVTISDLSLCITIFVILLYVSDSLSRDIKVVTNRLKEIANYNRKEIDLTSSLTITSEDEFADLVLAFNTIQGLIKNNVTQLRDNQDTLMEKERLASLGQLIGGIAHNLKTPIMSISGAAEGIDDLIKEYDSSIDDPEVNSQDHHDIAKDMSKWVTKIREYTEYMSDIITAVKGQAVTLNNEEDVNFTIGELIKRVDILMKHELKNALIYMNVSMNVDENLLLDGDINSLVQVINNMISNSIQAYGGKPEQNIDLIIKKVANNLIISIKDYGSGIPAKVRDKLFKEMVTTKGKNGTGLGLYMSYSTIRGHFNGDITVDSKEGEGTTFNITLPVK